MARILAACVVVALCFLACAGGSDPDNDRNVSQIIQARGYPEEDHLVITADGFILSVQRITGPRFSAGSPKARKPVVYLQHGLEDNSFTWVAQEVVNECLAFILADLGYDVWLSNSRGNTYSRSNINWDPSQDQFWAWSFDEMAKYDVPAVIDYILQTTGASNLSYVGHSQGGTMGLIAFENPAIASKVNIFVALAPAAWIYHTSSVLLKAMSDLDIGPILKFLGVKEFLPDNKVLKFLLPITCGISPSACENLIGLLMGDDTANYNNTRLPAIMAHEPSGTSVQTIIHWAQFVEKNSFQAYDYGSAALNQQHYNQSTPPVYNPSLVKIPVALFYGGKDALADVTDTQHLISVLPNLVFQHEEPSYSHMDFVWAENANTRIYSYVVQVLQKYTA